MGKVITLILLFLHSVAYGMGLKEIPDYTSQYRNVQQEVRIKSYPESNKPSFDIEPIVVGTPAPAPVITVKPPEKKTEYQPDFQRIRIPNLVTVPNVDLFSTMDRPLVLKPIPQHEYNNGVAGMELEELTKDQLIAIIKHLGKNQCKKMPDLDSQNP